MTSKTNNKKLHPAIAYEIKRRAKLLQMQMDGPKEHPTVVTEINSEFVHIDEEILPLINWLNSIPGISTRYCCQGDVRDVLKDIPLIGTAYVSLHCEFLGAIERLCFLCSKFKKEKTKVPIRSARFYTIEAKMEWYADPFTKESKMRYCFRWYDIVILRDFMKWLESNKTMVDEIFSSVERAFIG